MDSIDRLLLTVALPSVVLLALAEGLWLARRGGYDWGASAVSLGDQLLRVALQVFVPLSLATPVIRWAWEHRINSLSLDGPGAFALLFLGVELCYYGFHRAAHRVRWFWCNHAVHHSPTQLNLAAALRIGVLGRASGTLLFFAPLVWLGFAPKLVAQALTINLLYQFWIHATWVPRLGWLEGWLNTPSAHRVHHASNLEYLDGNYGGVLLVFDRLFGTYIPERADLPCRYGWVEPFNSRNPLKVEFTQWARLLRDLAAARSLRAVAGTLFMPPGWVAQGEGSTTEALRRRAGLQVGS